MTAPPTLLSHAPRGSGCHYALGSIGAWPGCFGKLVPYLRYGWIGATCENVG
jgi:hypothetical protein